MGLIFGILHSMRKLLFGLKVAGSITLILIVSPASVLFANWCIQYTNEQNGYHGATCNGDFSTKSECENARQGVGQGIGTCVGSDSPSSGGSTSGGRNATVDITTQLAGDLIKNLFLNQQRSVDERNARWAREEAERARKREAQRELERKLKEVKFQKENEKLKKSLKSTDSGVLKPKGTLIEGNMKIKKGEGAPLAIKVDHCVECQKMLISLVEIGLEKSAMPENFIYESRISYSNCMIKDKYGHGCDGTWGKVLYNSLALCKTLDDVRLALESTKAGMQGEHKLKEAH